MLTKNQSPKPLITLFKEVTEQEQEMRCMDFENYQNSMKKSNNSISRNLKKDVMTSYNFANYLLKNYRFIKINSVLHIYNVAFGYYQPLTPVNGDLLIRQITPINLCGWVSYHNIKETLSWLNSALDVKQASPDAICYSSYRHLNFMDGYLDVINNQFYPHNPNMIFTSYIPFLYSECCAAKESPVFDNWIEEVTNSDKDIKALLAQVFGYLISDYRNIKYIFIFYGPSNTGKSIWLNLLRAAIGDSFVKSISLHNLTTNFRTAELVGMKANICAEIDQRKVVNIDIIKSLVGGSDKINADVKNAKPIEFVNAAALAFSSNSLDWIKGADPGNALANRLCIIPFRKVIERDKIDTNFFNKLFKELPSIIYTFGIPGFGYLATNNFQFTCNAASQLKNPIQENINIAESFLRDACEFNGTAKIHTEKLYSVYINHCNKNNFPALRKLHFKELLNNLHHCLDIAPLTYCEKFRDGGFNRNGFYGITLKEDFKYS